MGLASAWALARRGAAVTVVERFGHVHDRGSHSGYTRVIRQAYHEGSAYVPLVQRADAEWVALQERTGKALFDRCGVVLFGSQHDEELRSAIETCRRCELPHEVVSGAEARSRWPFVMPDDWRLCFDPSGGYLRVGPCMDAMAVEARQAGTELRYGVRVQAIERESELRVRLDDGSTIGTDRVVVAAGAWLPELCPTLLPKTIERSRRILAWTDPAPQHQHALAKIPAWGAYTADGFFYGFPYGSEGVTGLKVAVHTSTALDLDEPVDPETVDRTAHARDLDPLHEVLAKHLPTGQGRTVATHACLYTRTPSWDFVLDRLPDDPRVVIAGAFSGHGFKFAPAVGEHVADLLLNEVPPYAEFSLSTHGG